MADVRGKCPVAPFERTGAGYAEAVGEWLADPHAYFRAFGREARDFQCRHRSERLRVMTLVAPAEELAALRPVCLCVDGAETPVSDWQSVFALVLSRLAAVHAATFDALQAAGLLDWLGCPADGVPFLAVLEAGDMRPTFVSLDEVVGRVQWLFLMCGFRLNEVLVQVDPFTDGQWAERKAALDSRRAADRAFLEGRRAAQKAWAETHPDEV